MKPSSDYGDSVRKLLTLACMHEQLHGKYPDLFGLVEEILHKEYEQKEVNEFMKEVKTSTAASVAEFEKMFLLTAVPKLEPRYGEVLKDILQVAHTATSMTIYKPPPTAPVRIYLEGCWDLMHSGHFNAIRQAKALGDILVLGVISDEEIVANKGMPVMTLKERIAVARGCKWVDEVAEGVPYDVTVPFLDKIGCHYDAHGDDVAKNAKGEDSNIEMKKAGRMKIFKRTEGVSTTDIVGRLLQITQLTHEKESEVGAKPMKSGQYLETLAEARKLSSEDTTEEGKMRAVRFLATSRRLRQFSNTREPKPTDKIVYVDGSFDIFHCGLVEFLEKARKMGDFLMVGIYDDKVLPYCSLSVDLQRSVRQELPAAQSPRARAQRPFLQICGRGRHRRALVRD